MDRTSKGLEEDELAILPRGKNLKRRAYVFRWRVGRCRGAGSPVYRATRDVRNNSSNDRTILRYSKTTLFATALNFTQRRSGE